MIIRIILLVIAICIALYINNTEKIITVNGNDYTLLEYITLPKNVKTSIIYKNGNKNKTNKKRFNKNENRCREIVEHIFGRPFPSIRPNFLKNPATGKNFELDMYCEDLKLAFEYNGSQHYEYNKFFHRHNIDFEYQRVSDKYKRNICEKHGITVITIPYTVSYDELEGYIRKRCYEWLREK